MPQQRRAVQERPGRHGYPRPQLQRTNWTSLNGTWEFAIDPEGIWMHPNDVNWSDRIQVPFAPETPASGIDNNDFYRVAWYRKVVDIGKLKAGHKLMLHFGAVDYAARVWVNGCEAATHEGGYTPFTVDVSPFINKTPLVIAVRAFDDPRRSVATSRQTGLAARAALHLVSAHHRNLANGLARICPVDMDRSDSLDTQSRTVGNRIRGMAWRAASRRAEAGCEAARGRHAPRRRHVRRRRRRSASPNRAIRPGD